jgi:hypothetical protein
MKSRLTDYLGISMLARVAVRGCKETEAGCIAGDRVQVKTRFCGEWKTGH